jgi:glutaredoxin-related protein
MIILDYYYSETCGSCKSYTEEINKIEANFSEKIIVNKKDVRSNTKNWDEWRDHGFKSYPAAVINNETKVPKSNLTYETLDEIINAYIAEQEINQTFDDTIIDIPFIGSVNTSSLSLPILTIVLGSLDSFNPCSFFILIFLLNLLLYVQSRRRMLLVGGIFIFFSGFFYFLFMFILFNSFLLTSEHISIVSLLAGAVALVIGIVNIKDFFFFKKGPSLSIPESKKPKVFKKMRNLIRTSYLPAIIGGTIFLAVTVNFYELLCTLGFPLIFTNRLTFYNLPLLEYYTYIFFYNVVYVIPLMIILLVFVYTLGRRKLTEWQGQKLKLLSGIMIFSFGLIFIIDHTLLENVAAPILLLVVSIISTIIVSYIWKNLKKQPEEKQEEES